jgi:hypothetical protein
MLGRRLPGNDGNRYAPEGYLLDEIGPEVLAGKGQNEMAVIKATLTDAQRGGCPLTVS